MRYTISTATLFEVLISSNKGDKVSLEYGGYIQKETDGDKEWFDLKTDNGTPCMDGETCELLEETENYVILQEEDEQIPFKLSRKEFEIAANLTEKYLLNIVVINCDGKYVNYEWNSKEAFVDDMQSDKEVIPMLDDMLVEVNTQDNNLQLWWRNTDGMNVNDLLKECKMELCR